MMNAAAFDFLEILLQKLVDKPKLKLVHFKDMAESAVIL